MPYYGKFQELPITAIEPRGWLRAWLETQGRGLTGNLEQAGSPFNGKGWANTGMTHKGNPTWWPYEQNGYWTDGLLRCALLLNDKVLLKKALAPIEVVLKHPDKDGYLGPRSIKEPKHGNRWAHVPFFRALMALYDAKQDKRILKALAKHYLSGSSKHVDGREVCNVEQICWLYEKTKDRRFLKMAVEAYTNYQPAADHASLTLESLLGPKKSGAHGVSFSELSKLPVILYLQTGLKVLLKASVNALKKAERDHMLIDGVPSSTERLVGKGSLAAHETCVTTDYTWNAGYLLMAEGDGHWADSIERACFNAGPAAVTKDFKALQYFSGPNQVLADGSCDHSVMARGGGFMRFAPNPGTECCPGNVNRFMPNYAARMWMSDGKGGLVAALYGPSQVCFTAGKAKTPVTVLQETDYPFGGEVSFQIRTDKPADFGLWLRVPAWCRKASLSLNGKAMKIPKLKLGYFKLQRRFENNDRLLLKLPMNLKLSHWQRQGLGLERGPLVYSLKLKEQWKRDKKEKRSSKEYPAWHMKAASDWNYALALDSKSLVKVKVSQQPVGLEPWATAPIELKVPVRKVKGWNLVQAKSVERGYTGHTHTVKGRFAFTPELPDPKGLKKRLGAVEEATFVPYGCTQLRMTILPDGSI